MLTTKGKDHAMIRLDNTKEKLGGSSAYQEMKHRRDNGVKESRSVKRITENSKMESIDEECKFGPHWDDEGRWLDDGGVLI
jgi:hypothetical protein